MKHLLLTFSFLLVTFCASAQSTVYFTKDITPEALVKIYKALGVEAKGHVAVKISTGEGGNNHYLKPTLIRNLVDEVNGTIVECCTAYPAPVWISRSTGRPSTSMVSTASLLLTSWTNMARCAYLSRIRST